MNFLSIDCSTETGSLFIKFKNKTFNKVLQSYKFNNDLLMKQIIDFLAEKDLNFDDIMQIYVNQGPGNFSGLRVSLATAKGISLSKNLKLFGYNTFIWSCAKFFNQKDTIFSIIKFREKYYIKKFNKKLKSSLKVYEVSENDLLHKYSKEFKVIPKSMSKSPNKNILGLYNLNIVDLNHNELEFLQLNGLLDEQLIKPLYLS